VTQRLYYADAYQVRFVAQVVERLSWPDNGEQADPGCPAVVLDRTAFYPTGGGQPHDAGWLNGVPVVDVVERDADGAVIHLLARSLDAEQVEGKVDWKRRFDLMQQHTGQHILSAAFVERLQANTVGFHLADGYATIDLDRAPLSVGDLDGVEAWTNAAVFRNLPVHARFVSDAEVASLSLRKPLAHPGPVRIIEIPDLDCSACGGTHVRATGEVGLIKITRSERRGTEMRVEFLCGGRALSDYRAKNALLMDVAREFTIAHWEVADLVHRLSDDLKQTRRDLQRTRDALLDVEAETLWHRSASLGTIRLVRAQLSGRTLEDLKHLAQRLTGFPRTVVLLAGGEEAEGKAYLTFARSADLTANMGDLLRDACQVIGGRGGGRPEFAQGGGSDFSQVTRALDLASQSVQSSVAPDGQMGA
jgi:alanyl-tRNA synthetase